MAPKTACVEQNRRKTAVSGIRSTDNGQYTISFPQSIT